eukprot:2603031-Karenia_brevis.AAC.1
MIKDRPEFGHITHLRQCVKIGPGSPMCQDRPRQPTVQKQLRHQVLHTGSGIDMATQIQPHTASTSTAAYPSIKDVQSQD